MAARKTSINLRGTKDNFDRDEPPAPETLDRAEVQRTPNRKDSRTGGELRQTGRMSPKKKKPQLREKFKTPLIDPLAVVESLLQQLLPGISASQISDLESAIHAAQTQAPRDKARFVSGVNRILTAYDRRLGTDDGEVYRLALKPGASGKGYIQFSSGRTKGSTGGFNSTKIHIVEVPENYAGARPGVPVISEPTPKN